MSANDSSTYHAAVDLGASGGRVALGRLDRGKLSVRILHRWTHSGVERDGELLWDVEAMWTEIVRGLSLAPPETESVGVACWGVDYALVDEAGDLVGPVHHYRSPRNDGVLAAFLRCHGTDRVYASTGIQMLPFNTLGQLLAHRRDRPEEIERAASLLLVPDFFHFRLTGIRANERTNASTTMLLDARTGAWADDLIEAIGAPRRLFGPVVPSGRTLGPLSPEVAYATGLHRAFVVLPPTHDTASAVAAVPAEGDDWAYVSSGTWSLVGVESDAPILTPDARKENVTNEAGHGGTIRLLKNVMGLWILQECRRAWGNPPYEKLYAEAAKAPAGPTFDADDTLFLPPGDDMPERVRSLCGRRERGEIARAILDSLAERTAAALRSVADVSGRNVGVVHIVGGGSRVSLLNDGIAARVGAPVRAGPEEATLLGNLLVQAEGLGRINPGGIRATAREFVP